MEKYLRQETHKEYEAHSLVNGVRALLLVAEQALERGENVRRSLDAVVAEAVKAHREAQRAAEEYIPGYCEGCVRIEMSKMDYGKVFPAFRAVASEDCEGCNENLRDERQLAEWESE